MDVRKRAGRDRREADRRERREDARPAPLPAGLREGRERRKPARRETALQSLGRQPVDDGEDELPSIAGRRLSVLGEDSETRMPRLGPPAEPSARQGRRHDGRVSEERDGSGYDCAEDRRGNRFHREPAEGDERDRERNRERRDRPPREDGQNKGERADPRDKSERDPGRSMQRADDGRAGSDAESEHDAEHVPVEDSVHGGESSRARPYPREIDLGTVFAIGTFVLIAVLFGTPVLAQRAVRARRRRAFAALERARGTRVIAMIHRQETVGVFGVPFYRFIDIDDSEAVLRAIRQTPADTSIDLLLHTPGGLVLASEQIAYAVRARSGKVTVLVPHYAMSGGTLIALAADEILMDESAVLGPVDPQLGDVPAATLVRVTAKKPIERLDDRTLLLADVAEKAVRHMKQVVTDLLAGRPTRERAETIAEELAGGHYTHDDPITVAEATELGLPVSTGLPREAYDLMELYPQEGRRRPSVQFVPLPSPMSDRRS
jgi:ClpP class serine protease